MSAGRLPTIFACLALSACSRAPVSSTGPSAEPVTLTIGLQQTGQDSLNGIQQAIRLISLEGLVTISRDGRPQPRLAQSWIVSPDGTSLTIQLRHNAVFHDGTPVDSAAVKASLTRTLAGSARAQNPGLLAIAGIETPTTDQVIVNLKTRSGFLLDDLTVPITKPDPDGKAIGTGPYVTSSISPTEVEMKAFHAYYRGVPNAERIVWKSYPTARTSWAAMMRGEIDFLYEVSPDALEFMSGEASVEKFSFLKSYVHGVIFNSRHPIFQDSRVRRALNYAVDRSAIVDQVFKGHGVPAYTPTWAQHWAYDNNLPTYLYDPARAAALLDSAGLTMIKPKQDSNRPPARLHFNCIFPTSPLWERMALIIQRNLSQVGVDVLFEAVSLDEFNRRILAGDFDAVLADLIVGNAAGRPYVFWYSTSKQNSAGYDDAQVDDAFDRLRQAVNDNETRGAFHDLQQQLLNDPPGIFLAFGETTRAVSRRFQAVAPAGGDVFRTISEWRLADNPRGRDSN